MNKKVLLTVLCVIVTVLLLIYWRTHSEDSYVADMDAIEEMIELQPERMLNGQGFRTDIEKVKVITKEAKTYKELYLQLIDLRIERNMLWNEIWDVRQVGSESRIAEIDAEMEQLLEDVHDSLEDFIDAAEGAGVGDYRLEKFIDFIF